MNVPQIQKINASKQIIFNDQKNLHENVFVQRLLIVWVNNNIL